MAILSRMWNNFKAQPDAWFFYGFLLTFTLSVRKVFFFYPIRGDFNEYAGIYLYLSDILLILTILAWIVTILQNKKLELSSYIKFFRQQEAYILALVLLAWAFMSISWSGNTSLALFRSLKLAEFSLLFLYLAYNALNKPYICNVISFIVALGFIQAIIGIAQAILQHSVGLFWLKESLISLNIDGVAKVMLFGHKFIRAYGLFPHPNILGGFLLITIVLTFVYRKMFHADGGKIVPCGTLMYIILAVQAIALLLTFSKSAILGLFFVICYLGYKMFGARLASTSGFRESRRVEHFWRYIVTAIIIVAVFVTILGFDINSLLLKSFNERLLFLNVSRETIVGNPIVGLGMGQFVAEMQKYSSVFLANWQYQPVHNVFLLIWSELGIIGLVLFILFLWKVFRANEMFHPGRNVPHGTSCGASVEQADVSWGGTIFKGILLGFIIIMLFDHYLWDIQQGQIMLWMILGLIAGSSVKNGKEYLTKNRRFV